MASALSIFAAVAALATAPAAKPVVQDPVNVARSFLEAFARDPQSSGKLATPDALLVLVDTGGSFRDALKIMGNTSPVPGTCKLQAVERNAAPSATELRTYPAPSFRQAGHFAAVQGFYLCREPDGTTTRVDVAIILKDGLMALLSLVPRR